MMAAGPAGGRRLVQHAWDLSPAEAIELQKKLRQHLLFTPPPRIPKTVAGADVSYKRFGRNAVAGVVVLTFPDLRPVEESLAEGEMHFPYIPGLLSFREGPLLEKAFAGLRKKPDLTIFDGQGIAHPRAFGIAAHLGLRIGLSAVGCAKSLLYGKGEHPPERRGAWRPLLSPGSAEIGARVRTRRGVQEVYVSAGHRIDLETAIHRVLAVSPRYRIPEPIRLAHRRTNEEHRRLGI